MIPTNFKSFSKKDILAKTNIRTYETKMGETVDYCSENNFESYLTTTEAKYVIIGIPEQIGVLANFGKSGTQTLWPEFLKSFLNIQSNKYLTGQIILLGGYFDFDEELNLINTIARDFTEKVTALRKLTEKIDDQIEEIVKIICRQKKIPIIIGGGHNNAYGAIKGAAKGLCSASLIPSASINVINLDAHTDFRTKEGRHSGNAFRYAFLNGFLEKYFVVGVHENYLQQYVIEDISSNPSIEYITYEDIFIREQLNFSQAIDKGINFTKENYVGLELDLDSVENILSSATSPTGFTVHQARNFIHKVPLKCKIAYLHICEGATMLENKTLNPLTGKLVSYLLSDFIKATL